MVQATPANDISDPRPVVAIVGGFGSGKTEVAVNLALTLAERGSPVRLVDLDIVNLYFRSREARAYLEERGVEVVAPADGWAFADLPIVLREVAGSVRAPEGFTVLDVGGDDLGARVLGSLAESLRGVAVDVWQVVNERRPFTDSQEGCDRLRAELEAAARLRLTGLVANAHLIDETTLEVVQRGIDFTRALAARWGVPLVFAAVRRSLVERHGLGAFDCPVLAIDRFMTSPWEREQRRGPLGRPPEVRLPAGVE